VKNFMKPLFDIGFFYMDHLVGGMLRREWCRYEDFWRWSVSVYGIELTWDNKNDDWVVWVIYWKDASVLFVADDFEKCGTIAFV